MIFIVRSDEDMEYVSTRILCSTTGILDEERAVRYAQNIIEPNDFDLHRCVYLATIARSHVKALEILYQRGTNVMSYADCFGMLLYPSSIGSLRWALQRCPIDQFKNDDIDATDAIRRIFDVDACHAQRRMLVEYGAVWPSDCKRPDFVDYVDDIKTKCVMLLLKVKMLPRDVLVDLVKMMYDARMN